MKFNRIHFLIIIIDSNTIQDQSFRSRDMKQYYVLQGVVYLRKLDELVIFRGFYPIPFRVGLNIP